MSAAGRRVAVLGGTSEIALAIVRELARAAPREVVLAGRDERALAAAAEGLAGGGCARVATVAMDALDTAGHGAALDRVLGELGGGADLVILAVGVLGESRGLPEDLDEAVGVLQTNTVGAGSLLMHAARRLKASGGGTIVVLSSVAAERARRANPVYGASKAGLDALAQGLADALHDDGVRIVVVRPGFVRTRMTAGMQAAPLAVDPQAVGETVVKGLERGAQTIWVPGPLRFVMLVMRMLPRSIFRRIER